jgi:hypothetical protein
MRMQMRMRMRMRTLMHADAVVVKVKVQVKAIMGFLAKSKVHVNVWIQADIGGLVVSANAVGFLAKGARCLAANV